MGIGGGGGGGGGEANFNTLDRGGIYIVRIYSLCGEGVSLRFFSVP